MVSKQCGILRKGVPCPALISPELSACEECCEELLRCLEQMADGTDTRTKKTCCSCPNDRDRPGQAQCKACHRAAMRVWRGKRVYVLREDAPAMRTGSHGT